MVPGIVRELARLDGLAGPVGKLRAYPRIGPVANKIRVKLNSTSYRSSAGSGYDAGVRMSLFPAQPVPKVLFLPGPLR